MPASDASFRQNLPLQLVLWFLVASFVVVGVLLWQNAAGILAYQREEARLRELIRLGGHVVAENENLTNTARMAVLTGQTNWHAAYVEAQNSIKQHFAEINRLAPEVIEELTESIESTSDRLQEIEAGSRLLLDNRYPREAMDLLISPEYVSYKNKLRQNLHDLDQAINATIREVETQRQAELWWRSGVIASVLLGLFLSWVICLRLLYRWRNRVEGEVARRLATEVKLERQEGFLTTIIQHLPLAIFAKDATKDYEWIMWNLKAEELFGLKAKDVIGTSDFDHFSREEAEFFRNTDKTVMEERKVVEIEAETITTSRGSWLGHTIKVPIFDENGKPWLLLGILEDITVRKQQADKKLQDYAEELEQKNHDLDDARMRAEAADQAKTEFLATMSHEIRTPLNGVIGTADLLSRTALSHTQDDYVRTIQKSGETLLYVINDILDITKLQAHQLGLEHISFDLEMTITDVVEIHSAVAAKKNLDLLLRYAPGTPTRVSGDPGRVRQILNNLISNALKFTEDGHILVDVEPATTADGQAALMIRVKDTGIGIAAENLDKVFDRFTQAETSTTRKYGGTGLGLAICKQLVELMKGTLTLESTLGQGSSFNILLPLEIDHEPLQPLPLADLKNLRVMVVDDNETNLHILREQLIYWGCVPTLYASGEDALAAIGNSPEDSPFDAAILDHDMPGMSGGMLGEALRAHPKTAGLPLLAFSSRGMRGDASYFEGKGFNGYLVKPSRAETIRTLLAAILHHQPNTPILTRHTLQEQREALSPQENLGLNILVVEDEPVNQKVIQILLEELGCTVKVAPSGPLGIEAAAAGAFDLIFMDMQMPGMDGPEATRHIRQLEERQGRPRTPIIALTANAMVEHRQRCLEAGMDDYTTKPINREKLLEKLRGLTPAAAQAAADDHSFLAGLNAEQRREIQAAFVETTEETLAELEQAAVFEDDARWRAGAHRLKGAALNLGYDTLAALCQEAETNPPAAKDAALKEIRTAAQTAMEAGNA